MYTHFNQHDPSITDTQDALLQRRLPGKLGNIRLGDLLLDERDKNGNTIDAPPGRLQGYIQGRIFEKGDAIIPTISPKTSLSDTLREIANHSMIHDYLTLAFDGNTLRYRAAYLGPIQRNAKPIDPESITLDALTKLRFFRGRAYIIS